MRIGSKPRSAICHCTPEAPSSERSQRRLAFGSGSRSSVRIRPLGIRASSLPPPPTTSKRMTDFVVASPAVFWSTISEPGAEAAEVDQHLDPLGRVQREARARDRPLEQAAVAGDLQHRAALAELELVRARVGRVEEAQPVDPALRPPSAARPRR